MMQRFLAFSLSLILATAVSAQQWPSWRGPAQNGSVNEKAFVLTWSQDGKGVIWKAPIGGRTTPIVLKNRVYLITPVGEGLGLRERVIALDAEHGKVLWDYPFNVFDSDAVENRVGWTSLAADPETEYVYAHATGGELYCFDRNGKVLWKRSLREEFGRISGFGGRLQNPIVDEDRVIVGFTSSGWGDHARPLHRYVAFDKRTGQVLWWAAPGGLANDTTYSNLVVATVAGTRMLIGGNVDGAIYGMKARTGEVLWKYQLSKLGINSSVAVSGNYVLAGHGEENVGSTVMGRVVCIDASKRGDITESGEIWRVDGLEMGYASPAVANGRVYVVDNSANLYALDLATGKTFWSHSLGRVGKGSPVVTLDGVIYIGEQTGIFHILKDKGDSVETLSKESFTRSDGAIVEIFGSPSVVGGAVFFQTRYDTFCLGTKGLVIMPMRTPPQPSERTPEDPAATFIHVAPGDVTLKPGDTLTFKARAFAESGSATSAINTEWSVNGVKGTITPGGDFTAANDPVFSAGEVVVKADKLEAKARVRVAPTPPFKVDFEDMAEGSSPPGWVGVARKAKVVLRDGGKCLQKLAEDASPPFMRLKAYMGQPVPGGYTIEADLLGTPKGERFKPDMGLINSRYELTLMGVSQELRLESWTPVPRLRHDIPFAWQTEKWYRMKFEVKLDGEKAKLRGKVWPREEKEPEAWTIEFEDPYPNKEGSPGLYGYSPGTTPKSKGPEVFFDNVQVRPNE